jgi:hypothetical protein
MPVAGTLVGGPGSSVERTKECKGYQKRNENGIGGSLPFVDFPGTGASFARDSSRAEGPTAGPNTEFLKVRSSYN